MFLFFFLHPYSLWSFMQNSEWKFKTRRLKIKHLMLYGIKYTDTRLTASVFNCFLFLPQFKCSSSERKGSTSQKVSIRIRQAGFPFLSTVSISSRALSALGIAWIDSISLLFKTLFCRSVSSRSFRTEVDTLSINSVRLENSFLSSSPALCSFCPLGPGPGS